MVRKLKLGLCATAAVASAVWAGAAVAADAPSSGANNSVSEVVVTGSLVIRDGTKAPTPMTVVTPEILEVTSHTNVADFLREMPQFQQSTSPLSLSLNYFNVGQNFVNLRGLGTNRNLVLLDGRRFVPTTGSGNVDINLFPQQLIQSVDIVTGGTSAAYGSDAIAGVVNFVLDTKFNGIKGEVQYGQTEIGDGKNYKADLVAGGGFAEGRGHLEVSLQYARNEGVLGNNWVDPTDRTFLNTPQVRVANPAVTASNPASVTNPRYIILPNARIAQVSYTGVIQSGPFANQTFTSDGTLTAYNQGTGRSGIYASGGDGWNYARGISPEGASIFSNLFLHGSYDLTSNVSAYFEASAGRTHGSIPNYQFMTLASLPSGVPVRIDNPFLSAATVTKMTAAGVTSLPVGVVLSNLPLRTADNTSDTQRAVVGLKGNFGKTWTWDAYYQYGENVLETNQYNDTNLNPFLLAADAVRNASGQIVCRSTLTSPTNGCVPINIIGNPAAPSAAALAYIEGTEIAHTHSTQDVFEAKISGEPFSTWAGPVGVGAGIGYRKDTISRFVDPVSIAPNPLTGQPTGAWISGNQLPFSGENAVKEIFGETLIPLLKDAPLAHSLDLNGAIRYTNYDLSGGVTTWKIGGSWQPVEDLRFRATRSRDIRAPTLTELFIPGVTSAATVTDRGLTPPATYLPQTVSLGNPNLTPEHGDTWTAGVVYQPNWAREWTFSLDYFDIKIEDAIVQSSAQIVVDQCLAGATAFCADIDRDPVTHRITQIRARFANLASLKTHGWDVEVGYSKDLSDLNRSWDGRVDLRLVGTYQPAYLSKPPGGIEQNLAGGGNQPDKRAVFTGIYTRGPLTLGLQTQWIGSQKIDPTLSDVDLADNKYKAYWYTDLSARYRFEAAGGHYEVFGVIQNLFQPDPPLNISGFSSLSYNGAVYDGLGRSYRMGLKFQY